MEKELWTLIIAGVSSIAMGYFWLDRKTINQRITSKGDEIRKMEDRMQLLELKVANLEATLVSNQKLEELRTELLKMSLANLEKNVTEIKGDMKMLTETILKTLIKQNGNGMG